MQHNTQQNQALWWQLRQSESQRRLVALNFSSNEQELHLPAMGRGRVLVSTHLDREEAVDLASPRLRSDEGCIMELKASY